MLTRIEIDGFKSFADFGLDLPPFLVVLGQNASGKSNLFDAIQLLRRLVSAPSLFDAFAGARGDMMELFRRRSDGSSVDRMRFAVELLLEPWVADPFGGYVEVSHTRFRYELEVKHRRGDDGFVRAYVTHEEAKPIRAKDDVWCKRQHVSSRFRDAKLRYKRTGPLLTTETDVSGKDIFRLAQDGRQGRKRELPANVAEATVLSSVTSAADFPLLYALRKEIESWRFLQLDPASLRQPSVPGQRGEQLEPSGANLAKVLRRIERASKDGFGSTLEEIATDLAKVVRGFSGVEVSENPANGQWEVYLSTRDEGRVSARVASDGTLRVLALLATLYDPDYRGLVCFEEPENGIFPQRLRGLVGLLKELVTDPSSPSFSQCNDEPLSQLILSSHSPLVLFEAKPAVVVMDWVTRVEPKLKSSSRVSRVRSLVSVAGQESLPFVELASVTARERRELPGIDIHEARRLLED